MASWIVVVVGHLDCLVNMAAQCLVMGGDNGSSSTVGSTDGNNSRLENTALQSGKKLTDAESMHGPAR